MPPKKTAAAANGDAAPSHGCNDNEIKLMLAILQNIPRPVSWDMEKIAVAVGATNAKSANERVRMATNKHGWFAGGTEEGADGTPKTPRARKTPVSRKKKQPDDVGDDEALETPTKKKPRATKAKSEAKVPKEEDEEGDEGQEVAPKKEDEGYVDKNEFTAVNVEAAADDGEA
ncbi:hypothetical protein CPLU01_14870 [Colletotrichum plurivorum]|uniref:Uncharacterized protein n=1 Tax=Colletotrichum plurivorum TaxID=2175906 RepID=A0A8H6JH45_9PEZI|nr:hypothetical protein CPLU01_14870 [Colletotrichum plurivorum]